jgi:hypothetical protein
VIPAASVACFGPARVLLGSDCPIFDAGRAVAALEAAPRDASAKAVPRDGNARRLFGGAEPA